MRAQALAAQAEPHFLFNTLANLRRQYVVDAAAGDRMLGHLLTYLRGHTEPLTSASFSPDGHQILTSSRDGTVRTYACQICGGINELLALAQRRLTALSRLLSPAERERYLPAMADG